ncbi:MAG: ROK family protein [Proteobacteria bacterium]|nr:ROK family protein [Pseudomonadota bacterium]
MRAALHPGGAVQTIPLEARDVETVLAAVQSALAPLGELDAVGVALPGFLDGDVVRASPNFPTWKQLPIRALLEERLGVPVSVENDGTAAAAGAWSARGCCEDLVLLTLGTGVGGGAVLDGKIWRGRTGSAGEFGHIYAGGEQLCGCGARGCLETWAGTAGWIRRLAASGRHIDNGRQVINAAIDQQAWAIDLLDDAGRALGRATRSLANALDPDVIVLSGGLVAAKSWLEPGLMDGLSRAAAPMAERVKVEWKGRAESLAIRGAAESAAALLRKRSAV